MTFAADFWNLLIENPMFVLIMQFLSSILIDPSTAFSVDPETYMITELTIGCGYKAQEICTVKQF